MKYKTQKYLKKFSIPAAIVLLSFLTFISCNKEMDDVLVAEPEASELSKSVYFYGSDAEFKELEYPEMTHVTTEKQLKHISTTEGDSYLLFVGKEIDIREGLVDNLRNSGILVTQIEGKLEKSNISNASARTSDFQELGKKPKTENINSIENPEFASEEEIAGKDEIQIVTYLSLNGEKYIKGSLVESLKDVKIIVPNILEWGKKNLEESVSNISKSSGITTKDNLHIFFAYTTSASVADFTIRTKIQQAETPGEFITHDIGRSEYPVLNIYNHNLTVTPATQGKWTVTDVQLIQKPSYSDRYNYILRVESPENTDNGVTEADTGTDTFGAGFSFGLDGPTANYDWSSSVDWAYPACRIYTYHNPAYQKYHVQYAIQRNGVWKRKSVTTKGYTAYSANTFGGGSQYYRNIKSTYIVRCSPLDGTGAWIKDAKISFDTDGKIRVHRYPRGRFEYPNTTWPSFTFNW